MLEASPHEPQGHGNWRQSGPVEEDEGAQLGSRQYIRPPVGIDIRHRELDAHAGRDVDQVRFMVVSRLDRARSRRRLQGLGVTTSWSDSTAAHFVVLCFFTANPTNSVAVMGMDTVMRPVVQFNPHAFSGHR